MIISLAISLILTIIIEITVSIILGIREKEDLQIVLWTNILTNPIVVYIANCVSLLNNDVIYSIVVFILEFSVVIVEFLIYKKFLNYKKKSPLFISFINNFISFSLGIVISIFLL